MERPLDSSQNSTLRSWTVKPRMAAARFIHKNTSWTANDLSYAGLALGVVGAAGVIYLNTRESRSPSKVSRLSAGALVVLPMLMDALDGPKSILEKGDRLATELNPEAARYSEYEIQRSVKGGLLDFEMDRWQELFFSLGRWYTAFKRGSITGALAADLAGRTNHKSSQARAIAELQGVFVKEIIFGPEFFGNRVGRGIAEIISVAFPEAQPVMDLVVFASNVLSYKNRLREANQGPISPQIAPRTPKEAFDRKVAQILAPLKLKEAKRVADVANSAFSATEGILVASA